MYEDEGELTEQQIEYFLERMNSGEEVVAGSDVHRLMIAASERAMRITSRMNAAFDSLSATRAQLERLFMRPLPESVGLFPPFTTDCGLNTHVGEGVFINAGCRFQDQGGIYIDDGALIGHNAVIATLNHDLDPARRANLVPRPVHIGAGAWLGANVTVLPGVTIGPGAVVAAGAVVTKDVPANTVVGGVPAQVIRQLR
ncbi:MAG: DapH/DapD/GlmU-related protein [Actinomycetaceae bacterium]|nr:DapH/DapD/GlmU-related protein [Actinomycetaceae bacterium]